MSKRLLLIIFAIAALCPDSLQSEEKTITWADVLAARDSIEASETARVAQEVREARESRSIGRYQLISGTYELYGQTLPTILKIDTATGQTWRYDVYKDPQRTDYLWRPIETTRQMK